MSRISELLDKLESSQEKDSKEFIEFEKFLEKETGPIFKYHSGMDPDTSISKSWYATLPGWKYFRTASDGRNVQVAWFNSKKNQGVVFINGKDGKKFGF